MVSAPKISIIVPVYNSEKTLERCISSILDQSFGDFELIIVNDGSTDSSYGIIEQYAKKDSRIHPIHKSNGGVSSARNTGLNEARGEYIIFCDSDDEVYLDWVYTAYNGLRCSDFLVTGIYTKTPDGHIQEVHPPTISQKDNHNIPLLVEKLWEIPMFGYTPNKGFKRSIIEAAKLRFNVNLRYREDDVFVSQYLEHIKTFTITDTAHYVYYLPEANKNYNQDVTACAEQLFCSQLRIFNGNLSDRVCQLQFWTVKGAIVHNLLDKRRPSKHLLHIFNHFTKRLSKKLPLHSKITYSIIGNDKLFGIAKALVNFINRP